MSTCHLKMKDNENHLHVVEELLGFFFNLGRRERKNPLLLFARWGMMREKCFLYMESELKWLSLRRHPLWVRLVRKTKQSQGVLLMELSLHYCPFNETYPSQSSSGVFIDGNLPIWGRHVRLVTKLMQRPVSQVNKAKQSIYFHLYVLKQSLLVKDSQIQLCSSVK